MLVARRIGWSLEDAHSGNGDFSILIVSIKIDVIDESVELFRLDITSRLWITQLFHNRR